MQLTVPTLGPILGYTQPDSVRIWIRGEVVVANGTVLPCYGVVKYRDVRSNVWQCSAVRQLEAHFDGTAVFVLESLKPNTTYAYECGWYRENGQFVPTQPTLDDFVWPGQPQNTFTTATDDAGAPRHYVAGSCRYLLRLFGGLVFDDRGDKCFQSILALRQTEPLHGLIMMGDQIYADDLAFIGKDVTVDDYLSRYRETFGQRYLRELMAQVPTYMILDDHEIENDWPAHATQRDKLTRYPAALHAYQIYQCSHSPVFGTRAGRVTKTPDRYWYTFTDGCADWFVLDARTERVLTTTPPRMLSVRQMNALLAWLVDGSKRRKLIVSSVPLFPDPSGGSKDGWTGFLAQRDQILHHIVAHSLQGVVFLSGDVHCSFACELTPAADDSLRIFQIVSSSFFWPYPHMQQADFAFGQILHTSIGAQFICTLHGAVHTDDNFAAIAVAPDALAVRFIDRKGALLGRVAL